MSDKLFHNLFSTEEKNYSLLFLRIIAAVVIFPHGAQKLFGWFGGHGIDGTLGFFSSMGIPAFLGMLNILVESIGAILLAAGLITRISAFGLAVTMVVAVFTVHISNGFFMGNGGYEFHILYFAISLVLIIKGGGAFSVDSVLNSKLVTASEGKYEVKKVG